MSIQSNINQGLGIAGFLLSQTPAAEAQKKRDQEKALSKEWDTIQNREQIMKDMMSTGLQNPYEKDVNKQKKLNLDDMNAINSYYKGQFTNQFFSVGERLGGLRSQLGYEDPEKGLNRALRKYRELQTEPIRAEIQRESAKTIEKNKKQEKEINKGFMSARLDPEMDVKGGETWRK